MYIKSLVEFEHQFLKICGVCPSSLILSLVTLLLPLLGAPRANAAWAFCVFGSSLDLIVYCLGKKRHLLQKKYLTL